MSFYLAWHILEISHAEDARRARLRRRRDNKYLRLNPFLMSDALFIKNYRLDKDSVQMLISLLHGVAGSRRCRRDGIPFYIKVFIALGFYAVGCYQTLLGGRHKISQTSTSKAIRLVTNLLNNNDIFKRFVKFPSTRNERDLVKQRFYQKFKMPGVIGCVDGTHVAIIKPNEHEERFYNRKGYHSLNVMVICDADLKILCIDPSNPGSMHDSTIWTNHPLNSYLNSLFDEGEQIYLLGDSGYPLRKTLMTPYLNATPATPEALYYGMHVTARNTVERCIGVLKARFRCCLVARCLHYHPVFAAKLVNACAVLHNIAVQTRPNILGSTYVEASIREDVELPQASRNNDLVHGRAVQRSLINALWSNRSI